MILPWLELLCGLMLLARVRLEAALVWAIILFALLAVATGQAWCRGLNISCGCLKLDFLGFQSRAAERFFESPGFAWSRAALLCAAALFLFRTQPKSAPKDSES